MGSLKATVKFYFEADKNHMPGKRIVIDWGDRTDTTDLTTSYGLYKNRVGLRQGNGDGVAGKLGCDGDITFCSNDKTQQCSKDSDCIPRDVDLSCNSSAKCKFDSTVSCTAESDEATSHVPDVKCVTAYATTRLTNTCSVNSGFGRATRACENAYIAFSHTYTCDDTVYSLGITSGTGSAAVAADPTATPPVAAQPAQPAVSVGKCDGGGGGVNGMCLVDEECDTNVKCLATGLPAADTGAQKCIFKPRVMVLDNWGWCNGSCTGAENDTLKNSTICYSGEMKDKFGAAATALQCNLDAEQLFPKKSIELNPWAKFNGTIEVKR